MYFYIRGQRVVVNIDDRIPVANYGTAEYIHAYNYLNNAPSYDGAWWLVLLEKAFSKLNVNYANLDGGFSAEALRFLTGNPSSSHSIKRMTAD